MYVIYVHNECDCGVYTHTWYIYLCVSGMGSTYVVWCVCVMQLLCDILVLSAKRGRIWTLSHGIWGVAITWVVDVA